MSIIRPFRATCGIALGREPCGCAAPPQLRLRSKAALPAHASPSPPTLRPPGPSATSARALRPRPPSLKRRATPAARAGALGGPPEHSLTWFPKQASYVFFAEPPKQASDAIRRDTGILRREGRGASLCRVRARLRDHGRSRSDSFAESDCEGDNPTQIEEAAKHTKTQSSSWGRRGPHTDTAVRQALFLDEEAVSPSSTRWTGTELNPPLGSIWASGTPGEGRPGSRPGAAWSPERRSFGISLRNGHSSDLFCSRCQSGCSNAGKLSIKCTTSFHLAW